MDNEIPEIDITGRLLFFLGLREIFEVEGDSMSPTLENGDLVVVNLQSKFKPRDIILAKHPFEPGSKLIKRIWKITPDGKFFLIGDNLAKSTDSRAFGELPAKDILGKIVGKLNRLDVLWR